MGDYNDKLGATEFEFMHSTSFRMMAGVLTIAALFASAIAWDAHKNNRSFSEQWEITNPFSKKPMDKVQKLLQSTPNP